MSPSSCLSMLSRKLENLRSRPELLIGGSVAAEIALVFHGWSSRAAMTELVLFHGIVSVFVIAGSLPWLRRSDFSAGMALYVVSLVALGPIGVVGCAVMELVRWISSRSSISFEEWYERLFPRALADRAQALYELIEWRGAKPSRESTVAPFCEVLDQGSVVQKQSVVTLIADHFKPEFSPALQQALNDPEPAIRVQAATAAARIENHFSNDPWCCRRSARRIRATRRSCAGSLSTTKLMPERACSIRNGLPAKRDWRSTLTRSIFVPRQTIRCSLPPLRGCSSSSAARKEAMLPSAAVAESEIDSPCSRGSHGGSALQPEAAWLLRRLSTRLLASLTASAEDEPIRAFLACGRRPMAESAGDHTKPRPMFALSSKAPIPSSPAAYRAGCTI